MDGVTILTIHVYRDLGLNEFISCSILLLVAFASLTIITCFTMHIVLKNLKHIILIDIFVGMIYVAIYIACEYFQWNQYKTIYTDYIVSIDESVSFNEFINRYEIISQDGNLYTVREKERN